MRSPCCSSWQCRRDTVLPSSSRSLGKGTSDRQRQDLQRNMPRGRVVRQHQQQMRRNLGLRRWNLRHGSTETDGPLGEILVVVGHCYRSAPVHGQCRALWAVASVQSSTGAGHPVPGGPRRVVVPYWAIAVAAGIADWIICMVCTRSPAANALSACEICVTAGLSLGLLVCASAPNGRAGASAPSPTTVAPRRYGQPGGQDCAARR